MRVRKQDGANELEGFAGILHLLHHVVNDVNTPAVSGAVTRNGQVTIVDGQSNKGSPRVL